MITIFCIRPKGFNVGNDAIYLAMQYFLYEAFGEVVNIISLPATSRYESQAKGGLTAKTIYEINQYGDGVIVGGGNLYENGELDVDIEALSALEVPLFLFSLSRGRIYNRSLALVNRTDAMPKRIVQVLNEKATCSLVRDEATLEALQKMGVDKAKLGGCPTVFLDALKERFPRLPEHDRAGVLLSIRNPALMSIPLSKQAKVQDDIRRLVSFLESKGEESVRILCHDHRDIPFAASFSELEYVYTGDVYTYLAMLRSSSLNVSYRLHATLPCLSFGTPAISISYDERAMSALGAMGAGSWNIDMIQTDDLMGEIADRYERLAGWEKERKKIVSCWGEREGQLKSSFSEFAVAVRGHDLQHVR